MLAPYHLPFVLVPFSPQVFRSEISWPRHPGGDMIARTVFALLLLQHSIIHMNVIEHGVEIFMPQQLLQAEGIIAFHQIVHGERVAQNMRADALASYACTLF